MKPQINTDEHGFLIDFICVYLCPSVVSFLLQFNLFDYLFDNNTFYICGAKIPKAKSAEGFQKGYRDDKSENFRKCGFIEFGKPQIL